jgi:prepilin-type N-terminal cleavage/methylation domain-containing protein
MNRRRSAFTLLELMTVVAILSILAAILYAVMAPARESARQRHCTQNLRQIYLAMRMYSEDLNISEAVPGLDWFPGEFYVGDYAPYIPSPEIWWCPTFPHSARALSIRSTNYLVPVMTFDDPNGTYDDQAWKDQRERAEKLGGAFPIVICNTHDRFVYAPAEQHIDPSTVSPFLVVLHLDGHVKAGRRFDFPRIWSHY